MKVAAVQAAYVLMDQQAPWPRRSTCSAEAAAEGARIVVFPEVFIPGTPIWIDSAPIWDGDERVVRAARRPGRGRARAGHRRARRRRPRRRRLRGRSASTSANRTARTIYNTTLYFGPDGALLGKHRKLMPTGSERTVWGMGDGSTLPVIDTPYGRLSPG